MAVKTWDEVTKATYVVSIPLNPFRSDCARERLDVAKLGMHGAAALADSRME